MASRRRGLLKKLLAAAGVLLVLGAGTAVLFRFWLMRNGNEGGEKTPAAAAALKAEADEAQEPAQEPPILKVTLEGIPDSASVFVDGVLHPERPLKIRKSDRPRNLKIAAEGYMPWEKEVAVGADITLPVSLSLLVEDEDAGEPEASRKASKKKKKKKTDAEPADTEKPDRGKAKRIDRKFPGL